MVKGRIANWNKISTNSNEWKKAIEECRSNTEEYEKEMRMAQDYLLTYLLHGAETLLSS